MNAEKLQVTGIRFQHFKRGACFYREVIPGRTVSIKIALKIDVPRQLETGNEDH